MTTAEGTRKKSLVNERQSIIYSEAYARRAGKEREKAINKAGKQIFSLSKDAKPSNHGAAKYIKKDPTTGTPVNARIKATTWYYLTMSELPKNSSWIATMSSVLM